MKNQSHGGAEVVAGRVVLLNADGGGESIRKKGLRRTSAARWLGAALWLAAGITLGVANLQAAEEFPYVVPFEMGKARFTPGDSITIQSVRGTADTFRVNESYCVEGFYTLGSADEAELALFVTTKQDIRTKIDPRQMVRVPKGTGTFRLIETITAEGYPHVSFYPTSPGSDLGGIYFGQGDWLLNVGGDGSSGQPARRPSVTAAPAARAPVTSSGANQVLFEYLGNPVEVPPNLDPAYAPQGLRDAVQSAAAKAGIALRKIEIDELEFPFLIGVVYNDGDFPKLKAQLKAMDNYEYYGDVGSHNCSTFTIIPHRVWPADAIQRIHHRATLRMAVFYDRVTSPD